MEPAGFSAGKDPPFPGTVCRWGWDMPAADSSEVGLGRCGGPGEGRIGQVQARSDRHQGENASRRPRVRITKVRKKFLMLRNVGTLTTTELCTVKNGEGGQFYAFYHD